MVCCTSSECARHGSRNQMRAVWWFFDRCVCCSLDSDCGCTHSHLQFSSLHRATEVVVAVAVAVDSWAVWAKAHHLHSLLAGRGRRCDASCNQLSTHRHLQATIHAFANGCHTHRPLRSCLQDRINTLTPLSIFQVLTASPAGDDGFLVDDHPLGQVCLVLTVRIVCVCVCVCVWSACFHRTTNHVSGPHTKIHTRTLTLR